MNLYHLRYFVTLAHIEHYTKAAKILTITQPSLSHAISSLEEELGVKLFEKEGRNIVLTKCGKAFLEDVEQSLAILDNSVESLQMTGSGEGTVDIGLLRTLSSDLVPGFARGFLDAYPDKKIRFNFYNDSGMTKDILNGLKDKRYDLAFCSKVESETEIEFTPVATQKLVVIVPDGHPLSHQSSVDLRETLDYPQIRFSKRSGLRPVIDQIFDDIGQFPEYTYEVDEDQSVAGLVSNNFGIAVIPYMKVLRFMKIKILHIDNFTWERYFYLASLKNSYAAPIITKFKEYVIEHADTTSGGFI